MLNYTIINNHQYSYFLHLYILNYLVVIYYIFFTIQVYVLKIIPLLYLYSELLISYMLKILNLYSNQIRNQVSYLHINYKKMLTKYIKIVYIP